ncbi:ATP-binding cassette domain-containing protein [Cellulomonas dongxiuzhuiae]|uniref:ATP-binding cassette domain-containing protein n=1 Tax=Cellulomonas dongxiuzhuiae TaxID=2819979 RepID=A0ABX8GNW2_9CELL|nr:ATP-binding cassette domain-containing protein [Cellulomonas dongxiuzhuiae]MBO3093314.1 ATP-binding cassette domain-containing protein [Cellulomonas dongxiuzhuiae]QWC17597.1 ATP-binding cassette domain-containing protein [Cellulomonas dongxiuzhuiae]
MTLDVHVRVDRGAFRLDVALHVPAGGVLAVMGPNGSGKSTLLEAVAGLVPVTAGHVRLGDLVLADAATGRHLPPHERHLGVALQDGLLFGRLSARENVAFGPRAQGVRAPVARATADALLAEVGLATQARTRADRLSGGQAQRVAVARAVAALPSALLLDEPFGALDAATRAQVRDVVRRAVASGLPALVVTHDLRDALELADELLVLQDGREVQRGAPAHVAAAPATPYVEQVAAAAAWRDPEP